MTLVQLYLLLARLTAVDPVIIKKTYQNRIQENAIILGIVQELLGRNRN